MIKEKHGRAGGVARSFLNFKRNQESAERADKELKMFTMGEPSSAFFPPALNSEEEAVVFPAEKRKKDNPKKLEEKGTIATAEDIKNRHKEQMERYIEYEHNVGHPASLPIGWMRYGVKHWEEIQRMKGNSITLSSPESSLPS